MNTHTIEIKKSIRNEVLMERKLKMPTESLPLGGKQAILDQEGKDSMELVPGIGLKYGEDGTWQNILLTFTGELICSIDVKHPTLDQYPSQTLDVYTKSDNHILAHLSSPVHVMWRDDFYVCNDCLELVRYLTSPNPENIGPRMGGMPDRETFPCHLSSAADQEKLTKEMVDNLQPLAESGHAFCQLNLGLMYAEGVTHMQTCTEFLAKDPRKGAQWILKAAKAGLSSAQHKIGTLYEKGLGVAQNYVHAYAWLSLAAREDESQTYCRCRDKLTKSMAATQVAEAQTLAHSWEAKGY
jgi:hypothetical protein